MTTMNLDALDNYSDTELVQAAKDILAPTGIVAEDAVLRRVFADFYGKEIKPFEPFTALAIMPYIAVRLGEQLVSIREDGEDVRFS